MNNYSGAVDQYIELINNFPEDDTLVTEAALYALRYQRQQQLMDFYAKTVAQSPRDYRWSMVLARTQTNLENYPAAIDTYAKAIAIRPDRADLYTARAGLEERLMRFDEAAADYERIYQLAYKDPQWMEKVAAVRARQGKTKETVAALQAALIEGRPENAAITSKLRADWRTGACSEHARGFAEQGVNKAGADLLASAEYHAGARSYVRIMTRLRQQEQAYATLQKALADSAATLPVLKEQVVKEGITGLSDAQWREHQRLLRMETARNGMTGALQELGSAVNTYFTPEERLAFAHFAESKRAGMNAADLEKFAVPLAESAALADQEAHWRFDLIMQQAAMPNFYSNVRPFRRPATPPRPLHRPGLADGTVRTKSATAAAKHAAARRGRRLSFRRRRAERTPHLVQFLRMAALTQHVHSALPVAARARTAGTRSLRHRLASPFSQQAADYVVAHGSAHSRTPSCKCADKCVQRYGLKPTTLLSDFYFSEPTPEVNNAFLSALGDDPIGVRLAKPVDRTQQLTGNTWFYYGSRYGEYLGMSKLGNPEDFLPAILEESPATASGYLTLADYYIGVGDTNTRSPSTSTRSTFLPIAPTYMTAWLLRTTNKATASRLSRSGSWRLPRYRSSSTASGLPRVSGGTLVAPAINCVRGICSRNSSPMRMPSFARISAETELGNRTRCCSRFIPRSETQRRRQTGCSMSLPPRRIRHTS